MLTLVQCVHWYFHLNLESLTSIDSCSMFTHVYVQATVFTLNAQFQREREREREREKKHVAI